MEKSCSLYKGQGFYYLASDVKYTEGFRVMGEPFLKLEVDIENSELNAAVLYAFKNNRVVEGVHPKGSEIFKKFVKLANCRSYLEFVKKNVLILIRKDENHVVLTPMVRSFEYKGFKSYKGMKIELDLDVDMASEILKLFKIMGEDVNNT